MQQIFNINKKFKEALTCDKNYLLLWGGAGSGKSYFAAQKIIFRCLTERDHAFFVFRKVKDTIHNSVYTQLQIIVQQLNLSPFFKFQKTAPRCVFAPNNNSIFFLGLDDPEKIKSIARMTNVWIEEATELNPEDFNQILLRMRGSTDYYRQIILTFNPISTKNWIYNYFFLNVSSDIAANMLEVHSTHTDNRYVDQSYRDRVNSLKEVNEEYYKVYALGVWGTQSHRVFAMPTLVHNAPSDAGTIYYGVDFGYNDPTTLIKVVEASGVYYVSELVYETNLLINKFIEKLRNLNVKSSQVIYCDSARPDLIAELQRAGFAAQAANKNRTAGWEFIKNIWKSIYFLQNSQNLLEEIDNFVYLKNKAGDLLDEVDPKCADHALDALRYALYTRYYLKTRHSNPSFFELIAKKR